MMAVALGKRYKDGQSNSEVLGIQPGACTPLSIPVVLRPFPAPMPQRWLPPIPMT